MRTLPPAVRLTLAHDQGKEMARHRELAQRLNIRVYFADPHGTWQRPTNENTNGLLRQHLPKGKDFSGLSQRHLATIATALNTRPRTCLAFRTPQEVMNDEIGGSTATDALPTRNRPEKGGAVVVPAAVPVTQLRRGTGNSLPNWRRKRGHHFADPGQWHDLFSCARTHVRSCRAPSRHRRPAVVSRW